MNSSMKLMLEFADEGKFESLAKAYGRIETNWHANEWKEFVEAIREKVVLDLLNQNFPTWDFEIKQR